MKFFFIAIFGFLCYGAIQGQGVQSPHAILEQQLENATPERTESEADDDQLMQQLEQYRRDPLDLNNADETELAALMLLSPLQIQHFIKYRSMLGKLVDVLELQAVPGWDIYTIRRIGPYVKTGSEQGLKKNLASRLRNGDHHILFRVSQVLEQSAGYRPDSGAINYYRGSPQKYFLRYRYDYKNLLQYGLVAEKDPGEQFFRGGQKSGFDFYAFHLFIRNAGLAKAVALGDFTVNMGQGLIQWQSLAFKKNADAVKIKRESAVLRPYHSAGESNFYRGAAVTLARRNWQATLFGSSRKLDANLAADSTPAVGDHVTSLQTSGLHRTNSELADKGVQTQISWGAALSYRYEQLHIALNTVHHQFGSPLRKAPEPYNRFQLTGTRFGYYSIDYSYSFRNIHLFGEVAADRRFTGALLAGLIASVSPSVDLAVLYRTMPPAYQTIHASAFTENTNPGNERGLYIGTVIRPGPRVRLDAYIDLFRFPWLKYQVDAPAGGSEAFVQLSYVLPRRVELYARYRVDNKPGNRNEVNAVSNWILTESRKNFRLHLVCWMGRSLAVRARIETTRLQGRGKVRDEGFLWYLDLLFGNSQKRLSGNLRLQYFETGSYDSRIYAYENDVLYNYSVPAFYNKGYRYYINMAYDISPRWKTWLRWSQTLYRDETFIGSGLDQFPGNRRSEVRVQVQYRL